MLLSETDPWPSAGLVAHTVMRGSLEEPICGSEISVSDLTGLCACDVVLRGVPAVMQSPRDVFLRLVPVTTSSCGGARFACLYFVYSESFAFSIVRTGFEF